MSEHYYQTKESVEEYIKLAQGVNGKELIEELIKYLPPKASILEIGSGPGSDYQILKSYYDITGSDYSIEFLTRLKQNHPTEVFLQLDAKTLQTDQKFDGIYSNKVFQHLNDTELKTSFQRQVELLNPGGVICHSFWKGEGEELFKGLLVNYQTETSLRKLIEDKFDVLVLEAYKEFEDGDSLLIIGRKK
ncbi:MAG: class I SAM-dependent methyltransferase [Bacteroidia bacterium]